MKFDYEKENLKMEIANILKFSCKEHLCMI